MIATWLTHVFFLVLSSSGVHDDNKSTMMKTASPMLVVFGKPGAGKTTVANAALSKLETMQKSSNDEERIAVVKDLDCVIGLDLDVCVPQWMKDNFSNGIYPTLEERREFALNACDYVDQQLQEQEERSRQQRQLQRNDEVMDNNDNDKKKKETTTTTPTTTGGGGGDCSSTKLSSSSSSLSSSIISFSFVNTDLRDTFRSRFPNAIWVLIDTDDEEATKRINERQDHFYKGKSNKDNPSSDVDASSDSDDNTSPRQTVKEEEAELPKSSSVSAEDDNSEWLFAPVTFPHHVLPGKNSVDENSDTVLQILFDQFN